MAGEFEPAEAPKQKSGLFSKPKAAPAQGSDVLGMSDKLNNLAARVRISEERYGELRKKLLLIEQNMLLHHKKTTGDVKSINSELNELKHMINVVEDRIITIVKELRLTARREDVGVMKRYVELWDPTRFVTREQVERIVRELLGQDAVAEEPEQDVEEE